jgi:hypothetical protein
MNEQTIRCPKCGNTIEITEAFSKEIEEKLRDEYNQKWKEQKLKLETQAKKEVEEDYSLRLKDLQAENSEKTEKLKEAQERELEFRKRQRAFEDRELNLNLEIERKLSEAKNKIMEETSSKLTEAFRLKEAENEKRINDLRKQLDEAKRKLEQGSQQSQGEILELELENILRSAFPYDKIEPVPKGTKGADVIQHVKNQMGMDCGMMIWESKRTKSWSDSWILKLKDDQREIKANVAAIVSSVLPKDITHIGNIEGIWISDFSSAVGLATALRAGMIEIAQAQNALMGKNEKMELVYTYLTGQEFKRRVDAILETFQNMKEDLDHEKKAIEKSWAKREREINNIMLNTSRMYGEIEGIIGKALPPIATLELPMDDKDA